MPPVFVFALGLMGAAALVRWCVKEVQRVNADLDDVRRASVEPVDRSTLPTLKPDPKTGEYRPGRRFPLIPAQAGNPGAMRSERLGPRLRGDERSECLPTACP